MGRSLVLRRVAPLVLLPVLLVIAFAGLALTDGSVSATVAVAVSAASAVVCGLVGVRTAPAAPSTLIRTALRDRARRTAFLPQRDPDAAGRRRPRAPGRTLPTAA
ncbi:MULTISPECIES: DUF6412 domain-containing protein [unclassified Streptomyces]|uniref:DUF6412 domain-containing protein n=1 Tax=unclassified Streptomyces TaxID=2593676 RepID=UPI0004C829BD|nr:DUF6412 domain-containing protein [Streptomyces sp. NRRL F-5727]